jgi:hypothetical protein
MRIDINVVVIYDGVMSKVSSQGRALFIVGILIASLASSTGISFSQPSTGVGASGGKVATSIKLNLNPGAEILKPVKALSRKSIVIVPTVIDANIPLIVKKPVTFSRAISAQGNKVSALDVFDNKPVRVTEGLILGGIQSKLKSGLPYVVTGLRSVNKVEIQVMKNIPTAIIVENLPKNSVATLKFLDSNGKFFTISRFRTSSSGDIELPPVTIDRSGYFVTLQIEIGGQSRPLLIRAPQ